MVAQCIRGLIDPERFPPRLFVLWATSAYTPYGDLLSGVRTGLLENGYRDDIPVIGASVAACMYDCDVHEEGAILVCLGSQLLHVKPALANNVRRDPNAAVEELLRQLDWSDEDQSSPFGRFLHLFLPGYDDSGDPVQYSATEFVEYLRKRTRGRLQLFGGVSSGLLNRRAAGRQFFGDNVHPDSAVAALVTTDLTFGIGMEDGLRYTGESLFVAKRDGLRTIHSFKSGTPREVLGPRLQPPPGSAPIVLAQHTSTRSREILVPRLWADGTLRVQRNVRPTEPLFIMEPASSQLSRSALVLESVVKHGSRIKDDSQIVGLLAVGCVSRYLHRHATKFDVQKSLERVRKSYSNATHVGCYMDGEIGMGSDGRPNQSNWSLSELMFADGLQARPLLAHGYKALVQYLPRATAARFRDAMGESLDCVMAAGHYPGAMISLRLLQGPNYWIVGLDARGDLWKSEVRPRTRRLDGDGDILDLILHKDEGPRFVEDAKNDPDCHEETARLGKVISFYAYPLRTETGDPIGVLQIDLGDRRGQGPPPNEERQLLDTLGAMTAAAANRAIRSEQADLANKLDDLLMNCLETNRVPHAVTLFVEGAAKIMGFEANLCVRLLGVKKDILRLVAGTGPVYEVLNSYLLDLSISTKSPTAQFYQAKLEYQVFNDTGLDHPSVALSGIPLHLNKILTTEIKSYAHYLIRTNDGSLGVFFVYSKEPWYFTQSRVQSLNNVAKRLSVLLAHLMRKQEELTRHREVEFLQKITPSAADHRNVHEALRAQAVAIARAASADSVLCFLYDTLHERFYLRAQHGNDSKRVANAFYETNEGLVGTLAQLRDPTHETDLKTFLLTKYTGTPDNYLPAIISANEDEDEALTTCEFIALPLWFEQTCLGLVLLLNRSEEETPYPGRTSRFLVTKKDVLKKAADNLAAFVYALCQHDFERWEKQENDRQRKVEMALVAAKAHALDDLLKTFVDQVVLTYKFGVCAVYLSEKGACSRYHCRPDLISQAAPPPSDDDYVRQAGAVNDRGEPTGGATYKEVDEKQRLILKAFLPIVYAGKVKGILYLAWVGTRPSDDEAVLPHHSLPHLHSLAVILGEALETQGVYAGRARLREKAKQLSGMILSKLHDINHNVVDINAWLKVFANKLVLPGFQKQIEQMGRTVELMNQLREHSQEPVNRDIVRLLQSIVTRLNDDLRRNKIEIDLAAVPNTPVFASIIEDPIRSALECPIKNAIKTMAASGAGEKKLKISLRVEGQMIVIEIQDTGPGMAPELVSRIMSTDSAAMTIPKDGKGLGLPLAKMICVLNEGDLLIKSTVGIGTTVEIAIPIAEAEGVK